MKLSINIFREILRLLLITDFSAQRIAKILNVAVNTVCHYRRLMEKQELTWDQIKELDDGDLVMMFMAAKGRNDKKSMPDYASYEKRKLKNKYLTNQFLWEEYKATHKENGYSYSQFTHYYRKFLNRIRITERLLHYPGEILFVDYAGTTVPWQDKKSGQIEKAQIFVATSRM